MLNFNFYTPTEVVFGKDSENKTGSLVKKYGGTKVLLHYGGGSVIKSGLLDRIKKSLEKENIGYVELGGVVPNPHLKKVYEGIELSKKENVDFILAVGGGSVIDSAKAIAYGLAEPEFDVWNLFEYTRTAKKCLPVASVLTIAAAGSEMSNSSVITNTDTNDKRAYNDNLSRPKFAIMNPELTTTLSDYQTASGCADILMHTMERYFSKSGNMEVTDAIAEAILKCVMANAKILRDNPKNYEARAEIMWASSIAHNGLTGCGGDGGDWASHMLEHEIGGMFDVTHGAGLAAIWGSWAKYVYKDCLDRFVKYAKNVMLVNCEGSDEEIALKGIEAMEEFYRSIAMPTNMKELGVDPTDAQLAEMAKRCAKASGNALGSAKILRENDMLEIYKMAK